MILLVTVLVAVAAVLAVIGFWSLPTAADRIVAVDAFSACAVASSIVAATATGVPAFLDVGIGFAAVAFVATVGWAYALSRKPPEEEERP